MSSHIIRTNDFSQFKRLEENREINYNHVDDLKKSIKACNKLHLHPIIVNPHMQVIDGHHRLEAAKQLKKEIYYIIDNSAEADDIILLNTHRLNWHLKDYANYYFQKGNEHYKFILDLYDLTKTYYTPFTLTFQVIDIFTTYGSISTAIRSGKFFIDRKEDALDFCHKTLPFCREINSLIRKRRTKTSAVLFYKQAYIRVLGLCYKSMNEHQYEDLKACLLRDYNVFTNSSSQSEILSMFKTSYNKGKKTAKFDFTNMQEIIEG